jgi:hypothetical protein
MNPRLLRSSFRYIKLFLALFIIVAVLSMNVCYSQDSTHPVYTALTYIKVKPGKMDNYLELIKTYSKKAFQSQVKDGAILGWYLNQVLMPSGSNVEYDLVGVTVTTKLQEVLDPTSSQKQLFKKNFPTLTDKQVDEIVEKYNDVRSIVRREIYTDYTWAAPPTATGTPAKYTEVAFQQPKPGKLDESLNWEKNTWGPIHRACIQLGSMSNWAVFVLQLPNDIHTEYSYITVNFFDNISQYENGFRYQDAFKKAWPDLDINKIMAQPGGDKTDVRNQIFKLVDYVNAGSK